MKRFQLLVQCLLMAFSTQVLSAQTGQDCEAKGKQIAAEKRDAFLQSCLAQTSTPANVQELAQQKKRRTCEQNAKNLKLNPGNKPGYVETCMNKNEAAIAAKTLNAPQSTQPTARVAKTPSKTATTSADNSASKKPTKQDGRKNSCSQQAKEKGLKGDARKRFMKDCQKS
ncbi:MAG: PsiF family protein [Sideroxyarcus sp.]|nr:PsiF family protein [Sideroxyarcus sp.]